MPRYVPLSVTKPAGINAELEKIAQAFQDTFSRKGDSPNQLETNLDINGNNGTLFNFPTDNSQWVFYDDGVEPQTTLLKYWNGASWILKPLKMWDGSAWIPAPLKIWDGSAWLQV